MKPKNIIAVAVAATTMVGGTLATSGVVGAESPPIIPVPTAPVGCGDSSTGWGVPDENCVVTAVVGEIAVRNRTRRDQTKTVLVVIRDPQGNKIVSERVTVDVAAHSSAALAPEDFIDVNHPATEVGTYRYVVRNVTANGSVARRNSRGTFELLRPLN